MALLTRSRRRSDPAAEALDRAREVSEQVAERARDVSGDAVERASEVAERARAAAEPRIARARDVAEPQIARAREAAGPAVARAREASEPALAEASAALGSALRMLLRVVALLPQVGARVLAGLSGLLSGLADRSAELADVPPPSRVGRRRRALLWFVGGFATGAAAGYAVSELTRQDAHDQLDQEPWQPTAVPDTPDTTSAVDSPAASPADR
jgi:hypothetical protein